MAYTFHDAHFFVPAIGFSVILAWKCVCAMSAN